MPKKLLFHSILVAIIGIMVVCSSVVAETRTDVGTVVQVVLDDTGNSPYGSVTYICYLGTDLSEILTEDGYNSGLGVNQGYYYDFSQWQGFWLCNFGNFNTPLPNRPYHIEVTHSGSSPLFGRTDGTIPTDFTALGTPLQLQPSTRPAKQNFTGVFPNTTQVRLEWDNEPGLTYHVYRAFLSSGAGNGASNGHYMRRIANTTSPYTDTGVGIHQDYWYILVPVNGSGELGPHSDEVHAFTEEPPTATPTPLFSYTATLTPTTRPTSTPSKTPTSSPTATMTYTSTLTPTSTSTKLPTSTPTSTLTSTPTATYTDLPTETPTLTPSATPTRCEDVDTWEPNDTYSSANAVNTSGQAEQHYFCTNVDTDWLTFLGEAHNTYYIYTSQQTGAYTGAKLYDQGLFLVEFSNFCSPGGVDVCIEYTAPASGRYYLQITNPAHFSDIAYEVRVTSETATPTATQIPTYTATDTPAPTNTEEPTDTPSPLPTETETFTEIPTQTASPTLTPTTTPTNFPTLSPTPTFTSTCTCTPTPTPTETPTLSPTETASPSPTTTDTPIPTGTPSPTETPTMEPTDTPTIEPTETFTATTSPTPVHTSTPTPTPISIMYSFKMGWNQWGPPLSSTHTTTALELLQAINIQGVQVGQIARWESDSWDIATVADPPSDFPLEFGQGYFILSLNSGLFVYKGHPWPDNSRRVLSPGPALFSVPQGWTTQTAQQLCNTINTGNRRLQWLGNYRPGGWKLYECQLGYHDFTLEPEKIFFIEPLSDLQLTVWDLR